MRAYHRVDPLMDERKSHYSPAQFGAFLKVQLVAGRQSKPGQFRSLQALRDALPKAYARHVDHLVSEKDLIVRRNGNVIVDGWKEWQEGDLTVAERMKRLRERQKADPSVDEAPEPSPDRNGDRNDHRNDVTDEIPETLRTTASPAAIRTSVGVSSSVSSMATTAVAVGKPRASGPTNNEPRLTQRQLDSWTNFGPKWSRFKEAWMARGLYYAPFGSPDDDDTSQRGLLWQVLDARPNDVADWIREAPVPQSREVITYILERWHGVREAAGVNDDEWEEQKREERRVASGAMTKLGELLEATT